MPLSMSEEPQSKMASRIPSTS